MVADVVHETLRGRAHRDFAWARMCSKRRWPFGSSSSRPSTRTRSPPRSSRRRTGILGGLWEKVGEQPETYLDPRTIETDGKDAALRDFIAGMTDRYAVSLFERLFIPRPWVGLDMP